MKKLRKQQGGFTIVELMIATLVFSVILMLATYGILNIGRLYRKSLISNQTQQTTRSIIDTVSQNIKFNGGSFTPGSGGGVYCLSSNKRLSFTLGRQFVSDTTHGLVIDDIGCTSATTSQNLTASISGRELLGPRMRLSKFFICSSGMQLPEGSPCTTAIVDNLKPKTYYILVRVIYGDDDLITADNCKLDTGREFCAVSELSTYVQKVIQ